MSVTGRWHAVHLGSDPDRWPEWWQGLNIGFADLLLAATKSAIQRGAPEVVHRHGATVPCPGGCVVVAPDGSTGEFP